MTTLSIAIFSFNRGSHLLNCIESVERLAPHIKFTVYDDASDDAATISVLDRFAENVVRVSATEKARHGGLYSNMNRALAEATSDYILFVQDDMQLVRPLGNVELQTMSDLFEEDCRTAFVCPQFMKQSSSRRYRQILAPHSTLRAYKSREAANIRISYFDASIGNVARLRAAAWSFGPTEKATMMAAATRFSSMPFLADPFLFFCPEVPIYRERNRTFVSRLAARIVGSDVKKFDFMSTELNAAFQCRSLDQWPIAEDWLTTVNSTVRRPFVYKDVNARLWLRALSRVERMLRKLSRK